ncbi:MAG: glutamine-hydrolyzing carbamoyl-phosphate synthase small subunit [Pseudomonadota bacterium]|nr:glutamine-hydrolyzing carbamoyl-phosphate synthase small subunit [Pseudomonadota bacterium]
MTQDKEKAPASWHEPRPTALLVLANGMVLEGSGLGATGAAVGEVCFNTAMTGYQEILTDPSYTGQIVTFTFPHIGNVGANDEDIETSNLAASAGVRGVIVHAPVTGPSNHRAKGDFNAWLKSRGIIGLYGLDTRALTAFIRENGMPNAAIAHSPGGDFDIDGLRAMAREWPGLEGMDLVPEVTAAQRYDWTQSAWMPGQGFRAAGPGTYRVIAIDYGIKRNILRLLTEAGCAVTVVPAQTPADSILAMRPDGVFLSNGPGDPAETGKYAVPVIKTLLERRVPAFGICLGHQMLALAIGAKTTKMHQGHHGANHPVQDFTTGKVEIVSMNHGFAVDAASLPAYARETHRSLFDGSNCGLEMTDRPAFSVQHHPEASPGPRDSHYLFARFVAMMEKARMAGAGPLRSPPTFTGS